MPNRIRRANPRSTHHEHSASAPIFLREGVVDPDRLDPAAEVAVDFSVRESGAAPTPEAAKFADALRRALTPPGVAVVWDDDEVDEDDDLFDDDDDDDDDDVDEDEDFDDLDEDEEDEDDDDAEDDDLFDDEDDEDEEDDDEDDEDDDLEVDDEDDIAAEVHACLRP